MRWRESSTKAAKLKANLGYCLRGPLRTNKLPRFRAIRGSRSRLFALTATHQPHRKTASAQGLADDFGTFVMSLPFLRYMPQQEFVRELSQLRIFGRAYVGDALLEELEEARLVVPVRRLRFPDQIARRFWLGRHKYELREPVEPDGARLDLAVELENELYRRRNSFAYGEREHPFDAPDDRYGEFIQHPETMPFQRWRDLRVDVGNDTHAVLFDSGNHAGFYATWQLLLAAEVADMGVHFRTNLFDAGTMGRALENLDDGRCPPGRSTMSLLPVHAMRAFAQHRSALDAVVWFAEEVKRVLDSFFAEDRSRRRLDDAQKASYAEQRTRIASDACVRYGVNVDQLVGACRFLADQWTHWHGLDRSLILAAYKSFLEKTVVLTRLIGDMTFTALAARVGCGNGWHKPVLDVVWPDWVEEEKQRVRLTLKGSIGGPQGLGEPDIDAFVDFLDREHLEGFMWRLNSFEHHVFRGNEFAEEAMRTDLQGMAVAVEHVARALGGTHGQLFGMFKELWHDQEVLAILREGPVAEMARKLITTLDWVTLKADINALRARGRAGGIASDLVMAHRIRGAVHYKLPEEDRFELEAIFVALMRAAALTFAEVRRNQQAPALAPIAAP